MKKGQAAMEFLMTYGWAILVVLAGIGALAYFGVLDPGSRIPHTCILFPGLSCDDFKINESQVVMVITNGLGSDIETIDFTVLGNGACSGDKSNSETLRDGETKIFTINCVENLDKGTSFRRDIKIFYRKIDGLDHNKIGSITTQVE